jgi:hypothetical protein
VEFSLVSMAEVQLEGSPVLSVRCTGKKARRLEEERLERLELTPVAPSIYASQWGSRLNLGGTVSVAYP